MSATETIIGFAAKQIVDRVFGGATKVVTAYHKAHFLILARALSESSRDASIQEHLGKLHEGLEALTKAGDDIMKAIPFTPAPPESDLSFLTDPIQAANFKRQCDNYLAGLKAIIEILEDYIDKARECVRATELQLGTIEARLNVKGAKWVAMRQISNSARGNDITMIRIQDLPELQKQIGRADSLLRKYKNH